MKKSHSNKDPGTIAGREIVGEIEKQNREGYQGLAPEWSSDECKEEDQVGS
jgi:hypothetical protein